MTYEATLEYLFQQLPMYHRVGAAAYKANLDNTLAIMKLLDHPERDFRCIHIAGTNGKGSTSHMLASILQQSGYKTGLYTSPHLRDFRERIRINGKMIDKTEVVKFVKKYQTQFESIQPSFFEWTVGLAFDYFSRKDVDIAVVETGLGGRLDSTNVVKPLVSVITNIQWDHMNLLGDTLKKIASEKAGIIKPQIPVVIGATQSESAPVFRQAIKKSKSKIYFADKIFHAQIQEHQPSFSGKLIVDVTKNKQSYLKDLEVDLGGYYQTANIATVLQTIEILETKGFELNRKNIRKGFAAVKNNTGLVGRWQLIGKNPYVICDAGHNSDGIKAIVNQLEHITYKKLHLVIGVVNDKDVGSMLSLLPQKATYYFCKAAIPRGLDAKALMREAKPFGLKGKSYATVSLALAEAKKNAGKDDLVFVGGSTFVIAEVV